MKTIKEINKKFKKKFPLLRVYNCPDHEPDEHFCEDEVVFFYTQQILSLIEELEGKLHSYRENENKDWEKGKYGQPVKFYGQGFNQAVDQMRASIKSFLKGVK